VCHQAATVIRKTRSIIASGTFGLLKAISVLQRYLKQTYLDTEEAQRRSGQVDNAGL
jgi:hypothetical protein